MHEASFYIKEQAQIKKNEIWVAKTIIFDPQKSAILAFEENPLKKLFTCFGSDFALELIDSKMFFYLVFFFYAQNKLLAVKHSQNTIFDC